MSTAAVLTVAVEGSEGPELMPPFGFAMARGLRNARNITEVHPLITDSACCRRAQKQRAFMYKVWSLAASSFQQALLLDADNLPLVNPEGASASNVSGFSYCLGPRFCAGISPPSAWPRLLGVGGSGVGGTAP